MKNPLIPSARTLSRTTWVRYLFMLVSIWTFFNIHEYTVNDKNNLIRHDKFAYYIYLPAVFIYHDLQYQFIGHYPEPTPPIENWATRAPNGVWVNKVTMGMAIMYSPFFGIAHAQTLLTGNYPATGLSLYYRFWATLGALLYSWLAIWLLGRLLRRWFSDGVTALTLMGIGFGTNYFYYTTSEGMMSHSFSFLLFTVAIWLTIRVYEAPVWRNFVLLGLTLGLITLIRPTNALLGLIPVLYGVTNAQTLRERMQWAANHWPKIAVAAVLIVAVLFPQLLLWKITTGSWLFSSYGNESFHFDNPQILNGLFSYRKGWYVYTPLMLFATIGIAGLYRYARAWLLPVALYTVLNVYIALSWWSWWYGGGFGLRAFVDFYPLMALGLASFIAYLLSGRWPAKAFLGLVLTGTMVLNQMQTFQYRHMYIHWDSMTQAVYWDVFGRFDISGEEMQYINRNLEEPDYIHR